jgi:hypothetical protein
MLLPGKYFNAILREQRLTKTGKMPIDPDGRNFSVRYACGFKAIFHRESSRTRMDK